MRNQSSVEFIFSPLLTHLTWCFHNIEKLMKYSEIIQNWRGGKIKEYAKTAIRNLLHANSCVHSRRLFNEFPEDGIKCMEKLQSHCENMTFADKSRYGRTFQQVTHNGGGSAISYIKIRHCQFQ